MIPFVNFFGHRWTRLPVFILLAFLAGCSPARQLSRSARETVLGDSALKTAHVGISIYEPATGKWWYNYQGDKYFVPASNTKIPTCYAAMKYLGDSLVGLRYTLSSDELSIEPAGDPTFLHPEYRRQPVLAFLQAATKRLSLSLAHWDDQPWGSGWSWNDYSESYMAERSAMPMYGNVVRFSAPLNGLKVVPSYFARFATPDTGQATNYYPSNVRRELAANQFRIEARSEKESSAEAPFFTHNSELVPVLLADTLHKTLERKDRKLDRRVALAVYSQPTDSMLRPMMYRSDNFYAEQSLLMVSNEVLGVMNDARIIDTILKTDFKDLPHRPRWVDGSGLSRYNLFTPQDMVVILDKMQREFGMERIKGIFPTGGTGTLGTYYRELAGQIYAKTGTLSGVVALSGYLYTRQNKLLIYSVLVNNHQASATAVRRAVETFLTNLRNSH
jgi:D-alanyl-D-alanine carboxypeptidase/D-alanyl-D-alanine-endopeptidase (penicillin-binding protein 4)